MNQRTRDLIKESWSIIDQKVDDMIIVYEKLYQIAPDTRPLFTIELSRQAKKLKDTLVFVVEHIDDEERLLQTAKEMGMGHKEYGVKNEHYEKLNRSFVEGIEEVMGDQYTSEIGNAWKEVLDFIGKAMIAGQSGK